MRTGGGRRFLRCKVRGSEDRGLQAKTSGHRIRSLFSRDLFACEKYGFVIFAGTLWQDFPRQEPASTVLLVVQHRLRHRLAQFELCADFLQAGGKRVDLLLLLRNGRFLFLYSGFLVLHPAMLFQELV
jgi:hypothetical protein